MAQQYIQTTFHPCTDTKPHRVSAKTASGIRKFFSWDDTAELGDNHETAAAKLAHSLGWIEQPDHFGGLYTAAQTERGFIFVRIPKAYIDAIILARLALSNSGGQSRNGNPHCQDWGKAITAVTDESGPLEPFASYYRTIVSK